jgi:signal transduction histidine kinase
MNQSLSLASQIKRVIGNRVLICSLILTIILFMLTIYDLFASIDLLKSRNNDQIKPIESFVISQVMIDNMQAIELKLNSINEQNLGFNIEWEPHGNLKYKDVEWQVPFNWIYNYQLWEIAGYQFGYFKLTGSFWADDELIRDLIIRFISLLIFVLTVFGVLYPLAQKIPQKIFINPINHFIALISDSDVSKVKHNAKLPIELQELEVKIIQLLENAKEHERNKLLIKIGQISSQVAHDTRSPLAALEIATDDTSDLPEEQRLMIRGAVARIRDIANNLLNKNKFDSHNTDAKAPVLLSSAIDALISEKRVQLRSKPNILIEYIPSSSSYGLFSKVNNSELKRILSNLINNAAEAMTTTGFITVRLEEELGKAIISIEDNGRGMSQELLKKLGQRGVTQDKSEGSGLGVAHAIDTILQWNGEVKFDSEVGKGTTVKIILPICTTPRWFVEKIVISPNSQLLVLDDDPSIHHVWNLRFDKIPLKQNKVIRSDFHDGNELTQWLKTHPLVSSYFVLCDYEIIGSEENGLDILERLKLAPNAVLVTSRYDQIEVQQRCEILGVKLLPKSLAAFVPIEIV